MLFRTLPIWLFHIDIFSCFFHWQPVSGGNIWWAQVGFLCEFPVQGLESPMQPVARWRHNSSYQHEGFGIGVANPYWKRCLILWSEVYYSTFTSEFYEQLVFSAWFQVQKPIKTKKPLEQNGWTWSHQWEMVETERLRSHHWILKLHAKCD